MKRTNKTRMLLAVLLVVAVVASIAVVASAIYVYVLTDEPSLFNNIF